MKKTKLSILLRIILILSFSCAVVFLAPGENSQPIVKNTLAADALPMPALEETAGSKQPAQEEQAIVSNPRDVQEPAVVEKTIIEPKPAGMSIQIPKISLNAPVVGVGLEANGELHVPGNLVQAGWYKNSPEPGQTGTSVITGHFDYGPNFAPGVFYKLHTLSVGDEIFVRRNDGSTAVFAVKNMEQYPQNNFPTSKVYSSSKLPELRLITCAGFYSKITGRYTEDLVVYAVLDRVVSYS